MWMASHSPWQLRRSCRGCSSTAMKSGFLVELPREKRSMYNNPLLKGAKGPPDIVIISYIYIYIWYIMIYVCMYVCMYIYIYCVCGFTQS